MSVLKINQMDLSKNDQIDLLYLTNPLIWNKYNKTLSKKCGVTEEDIKFYRKRILMTTKNYLRGNKINGEIDGAFENYADQLVNYFKFIDKKDMVQKEYEDLPKNKSKPLQNFKLMHQDQIIMRDKEKTKKTIKDYLPIVVKEKKRKKMIIPKQKNYDIKNPDLRKKGIK